MKQKILVAIIFFKSFLSHFVPVYLFVDFDSFGDVLKGL